MKNLEKKIKKRYLIFMITLGIIIVSVVVVVNHSVNLQIYDAHDINLSAKQNSLSQKINNQVLIIDRNKNSPTLHITLDQLKEYTNEWESSQRYLYSKNTEDGNNIVIDSMFKLIEPYHIKIIVSSRNILDQPEDKVIKNSLQTISESIVPFQETMDLIVQAYEKKAIEHLQKLKNSIFYLAIIAVFILFGEFLLIIAPTLKQLFQKNKDLINTNTELAFSENVIKSNILELTKLKADLETREAHSKIFIEQAPTAIAMLDKDMIYIAVSQRWITDYKMEGQKIIGRSHYDIFPEIGDDWKENHQKCLNGAIDTCDEAPFRRADGSIQWIYWDVRPWYISDGIVGGLLMYTGDITHLKEKEEERIRIEEILDKINEVARIGAWEINPLNNEIYWSKIIREIHEVSQDYVPNLESALLFFKEESRDRSQKALENAMDHGTPIDLELELVTAKGNDIWVRCLGKAEYVNGKCTRLLGILQDITKRKLSEQALHKANAELKAIFNSKGIAIISTNKEGIINHFNKGAEYLLGYSDSEIVGIKKPEVFLDKKELIAFRTYMAELRGKDLSHFNPHLALVGQEINDTREWTFRRKDGSIVPVQTTLTTIKNEDGNNTGYLAVSTDISDIKNVEHELLRKNQVLNLAERISMMGNWQWDTVTNAVKWSTSLYDIFGVAEDQVELNYNTYFSFVHLDDQELVSNHVQHAIDNKKFEDLLHRIKLSNGTVKTILLLAEIITNESNKVIELIGTCQDVTEQRLSEIKFRGLLDSAPDAMVIVNEKEKIQLINRQTEKLFGYTAQELIGQPVEILIPERFTANHRSHRDGFFSSPKTRKMGEGKELFGIKKSGEEIPIQISLSPLQTEEGLLVSAAIRDITIQKRAERKIIESKEGLEILAKKLIAKNTQLADFTHITSHNLRAPVGNLNSLLGIYKTLKNENERISLFEKFETVIDHLTSTLNTLVEALKTKNENSKNNLEDVMFTQVLDKTKEILSGEILKTGTLITCDFSEIRDISYNRIYLESIFLNLVGNAIKYKSEDRVPEIFINSQIKNGKIILKFKDNGLGIDMTRNGHKLFGLNKVFHRHPDAKGVGLFMTKTQIEAMGGTISATSEVNVGTTFKINLN